MTILDYCISLKMIKKILVVLGVVDMRQLLLKNLHQSLLFILLALFFFVRSLYEWKNNFDFTKYGRENLSLVQRKVKSGMVSCKIISYYPTRINKL